jgi:hypothetical protein
LQCNHTKEWIIRYLLLKDLLKDERLQDLKDTITIKQGSLFGDEALSFAELDFNCLYVALAKCVNQVSLFGESNYTNVRLQGLLANAVLFLMYNNPTLWQSILQNLTIMKVGTNYERYVNPRSKKTNSRVSVPYNLSIHTDYRTDRLFIVRCTGTECAGEILPDRKSSKETNGRSVKQDRKHKQGTKGVPIKNNAVNKKYIEAFNGDYISSQPKARGVVKKGISGAVLTNPDAVLDNFRIRKLTSLENWRLQGFSDEAFNKAKYTGLSDTQLYKQAGNAVCVPQAKERARCITALETAKEQTNDN